MESYINKPLLTTAVYTFNQECNTNGTTDKNGEDELLSITIENIHKGLDEEKGFYVVRTNGWSIDDPEELLQLFNQIKNII